VCRGPVNLHNYASGLKLKRGEGGGILPNMAVNFIGLSLFGANCVGLTLKATYGIQITEKIL
jgi:hypothetical protein